jgi:hypothetical protein
MKLVRDAGQRASNAWRTGGAEPVARRSRLDVHRALRWLLLGLCLFFAWCVRALRRNRGVRASLLVFAQ